MPMFGKRAPNYFARPTVSAYTPTPRDQVANLFLRVAGDTYSNRQLARNLFGSSGIGGGPANGVASVMDLTPAGIPFQLNEAGAQIGAGRPVSGLANAALAVVPIPAAAKGARRMIGRGARRAAGKAADAFNVSGLPMPERIDLSDAARMSRAARMGYTVPAYHGTGTLDPISEFQPSATGAQGPGIYSASAPRHAEPYAGFLEGPSASRQPIQPAIYPLRLKMNNPLRVPEGGNPYKIMGVADDAELLAAIRDRGFDGISTRIGATPDWLVAKGVKPVSAADHYVVYDPKQIRSAFDQFADPPPTTSARTLPDGFSEKPRRKKRQP